MRKTVVRAFCVVFLLLVVVPVPSGCIPGGCTDAERSDLEDRLDEEHRQEVAASFSFTMTNPRVVSKHPPGAFIVPIAVFPNVTLSVANGGGVGVGAGAATYSGGGQKQEGEGTLSVKVKFATDGMGENHRLSGTWKMTENIQSVIDLESGFRQAWSSDYSGTLNGVFGEYDEKGVPHSVVVDYTGKTVTQGWKETSGGRAEFNYEDPVAFKVRYDVIDWVRN